MTPWTMGKVKPPYKQSLCANLVHAPIRVRAASEGLTDAELDAAPIPGKWTSRRCIEHIVQVSLGWTDIFYEAVCPYHPQMKQWDKHWRDPLLPRIEKSLPEALAVMEENHRDVVAYLDQLPEESFTFEHNPVQWLVQAKIPFVIKESMNWGLSVHVDHHLIHLHEKRVALGKPLDWMATIRTA